MSDNEELIAQLNCETAKLAWSELETHFARGSVIRVNKDIDLISVAVIIANDDKATLESMIKDGSIGNATTEEAKLWHECSSELWSVVVAPWVLVQATDNKLDS